MHETTNAPEPKQITHNPETTLPFWKDIGVSIAAKKKLWQVGMAISGWLDIVTEANPDLYWDDDEHYVYPRLGQIPKFHKHDALTHLAATEEALRSGTIAKPFQDKILEATKEELKKRPTDTSLNNYELCLIAARIHDTGKFFEPRRPYDPKQPWEKPDKKLEKQPIKNVPFKSIDHSEIGQEIINKLSPKTLSSAEAEYVAETLRTHELIQGSVKDILDENKTIDQSIKTLAEKTENQYLISGALTALADCAGKGEPPKAGKRFSKQKGATEALCQALLEKTLETSSRVAI